MHSDRTGWAAWLDAEVEVKLAPTLELDLHTFGEPDFRTFELEVDLAVAAAARCHLAAALEKEHRDFLLEAERTVGLDSEEPSVAWAASVVVASVALVASVASAASVAWAA
jgi:hypothetical protein